MKTEVLEPVPEAVYAAAAGFEGRTLYHTPEWHRFLARTFGWRVKGLVGRAAGARVAFFLPFVNKRRLGPARCNVCLPLSHRIGPAWDRECCGTEPLRGVDPARELGNLEIHEAVEGAGARLTRAYDLTVLEWPGFDSFEAFERCLDDKSVRYMVRRARRSGIVVTREVSAAHIEDFYRLQLETRRRQGSPMYPRRFFRNLFESFAGTSRLLLYLAYRGARPVSGSIFYRFGEESIYAYSASVSDREIKRLGANELLMHTALADSFEAGMRRVDFGISPLSTPGLRAFKEKWRGESRPLAYSYYPAGGAEAGIDRSGRGVRAVSTCLRRMPAWAFQRLSPPLLKRVV